MLLAASFSPRLLRYMQSLTWSSKYIHAAPTEKSSLATYHQVHSTLEVYEQEDRIVFLLMIPRVFIPIKKSGMVPMCVCCLPSILARVRSLSLSALRFPFFLPLLPLRPATICYHDLAERHESRTNVPFRLASSFH